MSDQGLSPENTPAVAGPTGPAAEPTPEPTDWQKRYTDLQAEYTRSQQTNAEMARERELYELLVSTEDADTRRQIAEQLGYVLEEEEPEVNIDDPFAPYDERIGRLEAALTQRERTEAESQYANEVRQACDDRLDALGIPKDDQDWVLAYAINALPATQEGLPDIDQAFQVFAARETERQKAWARTKKAPHFAPNGQAATEVPNLDNRAERVAWMTQRLQDNEA